MSKWDKISLQQFQEIDKYMSRTDLIDKDKTFYSVCVLYGITDYELNQMKIKKVYGMINKLNAILKERMETKPALKIGRYELNYDPASYTLGMFISLSFYISNGWIGHANKILAVITGDANATDERAEYYLHQPMTRIMVSLKHLMSEFKTFILRYKNLFGLDREDAEEISSSSFQKNYGWIYSATKVAEHNRISLDDAMGLNVRIAFNDLAYLKAKDRFDAEQIKKK